MNLNNVLSHWKKIRTHRKWVKYYCFECRLYKQGLLHDLSKYSPAEFLESVKYYSGTASPITACKKDKVYSMAWFHHRGHNKHHYEYWYDNFDTGGTPVLMPYKYFAEQVCDYLGAARAYSENSFSMESEYAWWQEKKQKCAMHPKNMQMLDIIFWDFMQAEKEGYTSIENLMREGYLKKIYDANK